MAKIDLRAARAAQKEKQEENDRRLEAGKPTLDAVPATEAVAEVENPSETRSENKAETKAVAKPKPKSKAVKEKGADAEIAGRRGRYRKAGPLHTSKFSVSCSDELYSALIDRCTAEKKGISEFVNEVLGERLGVE